jgi:hypothetical protein
MLAFILPEVVNLREDYEINKKAPRRSKGLVGSGFRRDQPDLRPGEKGG